jgi:uncharacterized protein YneF (UPF0154 family)
LSVVVDVVKSVVDVVSDAVEWVGDAISDVADFVADDILEPVGEFVGDFVEGMLDDPLFTAAKIAAIATGNAWAIPLISGAQTAIRGGDFGDVLKTVAISYATQTIGAEISDFASGYVSEAVGDAVGSEIATEIISEAVGSGTASAFSALLYGTDPLKAFATGGLSAAVNAIGGKIAEEVGFDFKSEVKDKNGNVVRNPDGTPKVETSPIPNVVMNVVKAAVGAKLSGQKITGTLLAGAAAEGLLTMELVSSVGKDLGIDFEKGSPELIYTTAALSRVASIAASGGTGEQAANAIKSTIDAYGVAKLTKAIKNSKVGDYVSDTIDMISGDYQKAESIVAKITTASEKRSALANEYEDKRTELNGILGDIDTLKNKISGMPTGTTAQQNAYNAEVAKLNNLVKSFNNKYNTYKPRMDVLKSNIEKYNTQIDTYSDQLTAAQVNLQRDMDRLDDKFKPLTSGLVQAVVKTMDVNFNETEYKRINNLGADVNGFDHFLANADKSNVFTNYKQYDAALDKNVVSLITSGLRDANIDITTIDKDVLKKMYADVKTGLNKSADAGASVMSNQDMRDFYTDIISETLVRNTPNPYKNATLTPELRNRLETLGFDMSGVMGGEELDSTEKAALFSQDRQGTSPGAAVLGNGVSWNDVTNGKANLVISSNGTRTWEKNKTSSYEIWDPTWGRVTVTETPGINGITTVYTDSENKEVLRIEPLEPIVTEQDKLAALYQVSTGEKARFLKAAKTMGLDTEQANFALSMMERAKSTGNSEFINVAANVLRAGGGILQAFNGVVSLFGVAPPDTLLGKWSSKLVALGEATNTDAYKEELKALNSSMNANGDTYTAAYKAAKAAGKTEEQAKAAGLAAQKALPWYERAFETVSTMAGAIKDHPSMFFAEYIGVEAVQELVPLAVGGVASLGVKGAMWAAGKTLSTRIAARAGVAAAGASDIAEAYGATAADAYDRAYDTAKQTGMSDAAAKEYALDLAVKAGTVAAGAAALSMGVGGLALEKAILNKNVVGGKLAGGFNTLAKRIAEGGKVSITEGVSESIEEGLAQAYVAAHLQQLDPTIDVSKEAAGAAFMGFLIGGTVAGGAYGVAQTGDIVSNLNSALNPEVNTLIKSTPNTKAGIAEATSTLNSMGITGTDQTNILNSIADDKYVSTAEVISAATQAGHDQGYTFTNADIDNLAGVASNKNNDAAIDRYADVRATTVQEVIDRAAAEGYTLSVEDAQEFVGQGGANFESNTLIKVGNKYDLLATTAEEVRARFAELGFKPSNAQVNSFIKQGNEAGILSSINTYVNPRQVTEAEARKFFTDLGFKPTNAQVKQFVGQGGANFQTTTGTNIGTFVDPRQLTEQEVRDLYAKYGYKPSKDEVSQFVGQGEENFEKTAPSRIFEYVDPRQVTNEEARKFFADLGYDPSDAEVASFVAQVEQTTQAKNIAKYVDPRQVTMEELQAIAKEEGLTLTQALAETYIGQGLAADYEATQLAAARKEYDPLATTLAEAEEFFAATGYTASPEELASFVASKTEETQRSAISAYVNPRQVTEAEAVKFFSDLGYAATPDEVKKFVGQLNDDTYEQTQLTNVGAYVDPRMVDITEVNDFITGLGLDITKAREEDVNKLVGQYDESLLASRVQEALPVLTYNMLSDELTAVENLLGKPGQEVTKADVDFITDAIASNIVLNEQQTAQYDVNADGVVDAQDQTLLESALSGQAVPFADTSVYAPTGMYKTLQDQRIQAATDKQTIIDQMTEQNRQIQEDLQTKIDEQTALNTEMNTQIQTQIQTNYENMLKEASAQRGRATLDRMLGTPGYSLEAKQVDPLKLDYIYDFSSIFATPQQEALFVSPYRKGGQVDATTDKLLRIIGGS